MENTLIHLLDTARTLARPIPSLLFEQREVLLRESFFLTKK